MMDGSGADPRPAARPVVDQRLHGASPPRVMRLRSQQDGAGHGRRKPDGGCGLEPDHGGTSTFVGAGDGVFVPAFRRRPLRAVPCDRGAGAAPAVYHCAPRVHRRGPGVAPTAIVVGRLQHPARLTQTRVRAPQVGLNASAGAKNVEVSPWSNCRPHPPAHRSARARREPSPSAITTGSARGWWDWTASTTCRPSACSRTTPPASSITVRAWSSISVPPRSSTARSSTG